MIGPGTLLQNRYRVAKQIGQGGMGAVYVATDERFQSTVAIKQTFFDDPSLRKAFEREAHLLNHLRHASLPKVSDHFEEADGQFLVMEYIEGNDFSDMLKERGRAFPLAEVLRWADELLDALDYLHTHEPPVVHRDIKPQNMKLTKRGHVVLLDFGLAKGMTQAMTQATANSASVFGYSPTYAPLEQIQGTGTDARSDLYSLAATLYHLMTGTPPVDALSRATAVINNQPDPLKPAHAVHAQIPSSVGQVIQRALSLKATLRPRGASEMRAALRQVAVPARVDGAQKAPSPFARQGQPGPADPTVAGTIVGDAAYQPASSVSRTFRPPTQGRLTEPMHGETTVVDDVTRGAQPRPNNFRPAEFSETNADAGAKSAMLRGGLVAAALLVICAVAFFTLTRGSGQASAGVEAQTVAPSSAPADAQTGASAGTQSAGATLSPRNDEGNAGGQSQGVSAGAATQGGTQAGQQAPTSQAAGAQPVPAGDSSAGASGRPGLVIQQPMPNLPPPSTDNSAAEEARRLEEARRAEEARRSEDARRAEDERRRQAAYPPPPDGHRPPPPDGHRPPPPPPDGRRPPPGFPPPSL